MNLSIAIIGQRKSFCGECKFLASVEIQEHQTMNYPIQLCTVHFDEFMNKCEQVLLELKHG